MNDEQRATVVYIFNAAHRTWGDFLSAQWSLNHAAVYSKGLGLPKYLQRWHLVF